MFNNSIIKFEKENKKLKNENEILKKDKKFLILEIESLNRKIILENEKKKILKSDFEHSKGKFNNMIDINKNLDETNQKLLENIEKLKKDFDDLILNLEKKENEMHSLKKENQNLKKEKENAKFVERIVNLTNDKVITITLKNKNFCDKSTITNFQNDCCNSDDITLEKILKSSFKTNEVLYLKEKIQELEKQISDKNKIIESNCNENLFEFPNDDIIEKELLNFNDDLFNIPSTSNFLS